MKFFILAEQDFSLLEKLISVVLLDRILISSINEGLEDSILS